jgi:hypothetical protein
MSMDGEQAPNFKLSHIKGRAVALEDYRGRKLVAIFASKDTGEQARNITRALRARFRHDELATVSVLDMHSVPKLVQPVVKGLLNKAYGEAVEQLQGEFRAKGEPPPDDPSQFVVMLPDWDGKVTASFGIKDVKKEAVAVLIDENGRRVGSGTGEQAAHQILALIT